MIGITIFLFIVFALLFYVFSVVTERAGRLPRAILAVMFSIIVTFLLFISTEINVDRQVYHVLTKDMKQLKMAEVSRIITKKDTVYKYIYVDADNGPRRITTNIPLLFK